MARPIRGLEMDSEQRKELESLVRAPTTPQRSVQRARILLACAEGLSQQEVARRMAVRRRIVTKWCGRFRKVGLAGLADAGGRGRKPSLSDETRALIVTQATRPPKGRTRHSVRSMARMAQVSVGTVHALWQANDIKPHLTRTFKLSTDPQFEAKFWDVVGLYLNPPDKALVLCCDEKSQCQALERTQPGLPLGVGHIQTRTHDYIRHGTVTLFAALSYLDGKILSRTAEQHTHKEWLAFLKLIERQTPAGRAIHLIIDNYGTHKHPTVKAWLARHPRFHLHFTPTHSSWLNQVERWFALLTERQIKRGSHHTVQALERAIEEFIEVHNENPRAFQWTKSADEILKNLQRFASETVAIHQG